METNIAKKRRTYRAFSVPPLLMRAQPNNSIQRTRQIALLSVHFQEFTPRTRREFLVETLLVGFLSLFLVVQSQPQVCEDLPFWPGLTIGDMLGFEVSDLGAEDSPYSQVLQRVD